MKVVKEDVSQPIFKYILHLTQEEYDTILVCISRVERDGYENRPIMESMKNSKEMRWGEKDDFFQELYYCR